MISLHPLILSNKWKLRFCLNYPTLLLLLLAFFPWYQCLPSRAKTLASNGCLVIPITNTCEKAVKPVGDSTLIYICKWWLPVRFEFVGGLNSQSIYVKKVNQLYFSKLGSIFFHVTTLVLCIPKFSYPLSKPRQPATFFKYYTTSTSSTCQAS